MSTSPGSLLLSLLNPGAAERDVASCMHHYLHEDYAGLKIGLQKLIQDNEPCQDGIVLPLLREMMESDPKKERLAQHINTSTVFQSSFPDKLVDLLSRLRTARMDQACHDRGITAKGNIRGLILIATRLINDHCASELKLSPKRIGSYQKWYEEVTLDGQESFRRSMFRARQDVARILFSQNWRDHLGPFSFLKLVIELRLRVYDFLLPPDNQKSTENRCFLQKHKVVVTTNALPGLPTLLSDDTEWDFYHEMVLPLLLTCKTVTQEVAGMFFGQRRHEISITPDHVYWLGSDYWCFGAQSPVHSHFSRIRSLRVTVYTDTSETDVTKATAQVDRVASQLQQLKELLQLDVLLIPLPHFSARKAIPLADVEGLWQPLKRLCGIENVSIRLRDGPSPESICSAWWWGEDFLPPRKLERLQWVLPNDPSQTRWDEMKSEIVAAVGIFEKACGDLRVNNPQIQTPRVAA